MIGAYIYACFTLGVFIATWVDTEGCDMGERRRARALALIAPAVLLTLGIALIINHCARRIK